MAFKIYGAFIIIMMIGIGIAVWLDDEPCERELMGYNCHGKTCECRRGK